MVSLRDGILLHTPNPSQEGNKFIFAVDERAVFRRGRRGGGRCYLSGFKYRRLRHAHASVGRAPGGKSPPTLRRGLNRDFCYSRGTYETQYQVPAPVPCSSQGQVSRAQACAGMTG